MSTLAASFFAEAEKIEKRKSIWVRLPNNKWYHTYNHILVQHKINELWEYGKHYSRTIS